MEIFHTRGPLTPSTPRKGLNSNGLRLIRYIVGHYFSDNSSNYLP